MPLHPEWHTFQSFNYFQPLAMPYAKPLFCFQPLAMPYAQTVAFLHLFSLVFFFPCYDFDAKATSIDCFFHTTTAFGVIVFFFIVSGCHHCIWSNATTSGATPLSKLLLLPGWLFSFFGFLPHRMPPFIATDATPLWLIVFFL